MTPITHFYARFLPLGLVPIALGITYTAMLIGVVSLFGYAHGSQTLYLDIDGNEW